MKGAPEKILELCSTISINGSNQSLSPAQKSKIEDILLELGSKGERVLGKIQIWRFFNIQESNQLTDLSLFYVSPFQLSPIKMLSRF